MTMEIISLLLIVLFVYAAVAKLIDFEKFQVQIGQSPLLTAFTVPVSFLTPAIELIAALLLGMPNLRMYGLYVAVLLMSLFSAYIVAILKFSDYIPCSCGGILANLGWKEHLAFNLIFLLLSIFAIILLDETKEKPITLKKETAI